MSKSKPKIQVTKDGPYLVSGAVPLAKEMMIAGSSGNPEEWQAGPKYPAAESYALCRCGHSKNPPFCDGSHLATKFDGTETASREAYLTQVEDEVDGPEIKLTDATAMCSLGRYCHEGQGTWQDVEDSGDPEIKERAIRSACNCPSGRLVVWDKATGKAIEPKFSPAISVTEDLPAQMSGPLWVKGQIEVEGADGKSYEPRNRVTLCRCGQSGNKPLCDGSHLRCGFNDGDENLN